jgi:hypothetical protein
MPAKLPTATVAAARAAIAILLNVVITSLLFGPLDLSLHDERAEVSVAWATVAEINGAVG